MSEAVETVSAENGAAEPATEDGVSKDIATTSEENAPSANVNNPAAHEPSRMESAMALLKSLLIRAMIIYFITTVFRKSSTPTPSATTATGASTIAAANIFNNGTELSLHVYLSDKEHYLDFKSESLFWLKEGLIYGDWNAGPNGDGTFSFKNSVSVTESMRSNGSLYIHAFITKFGESPNPKSANYGKSLYSSTIKPLNRYKKLKNSGTKNLLTGETEKLEVAEGKIISHWHPNITLNLVTDYTAWSVGTVPSPFDEYIKFIDNGKLYKPVLFANDYWNMAKDYAPLNETLSLEVTYQPISLFKWQLYSAQVMRNKWNLFGDSEVDQSDEEQDTLKETLLETNPYLLAITVAVSILHSIFELLAFKNDIQFWNNRNSLEGLSVRSVFFSVFQSLVVLLYVLDNDTNTVVRISCFVGLGIELWKIQKVVDIKLVGFRLQITDKGSYIESSTKTYDKLAFKYLSWVCFPLLACYCAYALLYLEHKGWYSFVLDLLYGYLLTFGFIMMTPQLFINYKLKSVAHLPWRMLTYKFLNTFIDDMFAFVIKMPTMYRLGCFRDDIIFLIFLYQKWMYPVDRTRRNEFGFVAEPKEEIKAVEPKEEIKAVEAIEDKKTQ